MELSQFRQNISKKNKKSLYELDLLIAHYIQKTREFIITYPEFNITAGQSKQILKAWRERNKGIPLAYLTGYTQFYGFDFLVNKNVLIPRPETEIMIDLVTKIVKNLTAKNYIFYDIGTGSGCIIVTLARLLGGKNRYLASDISSKALKIAKINAKSLLVNNSIAFRKGHLARPFLNDLKTADKTIFIIANLPYLTQKQFDRSPSIQYEPINSLVCAHNGLELYHNLINQLKALKKYKFYLLCEICPGQFFKIKKIAQKLLPESKINFEKDYSGRKRIIIIKNNYGALLPD